MYEALQCPTIRPTDMVSQSDGILRRMVGVRVTQNVRMLTKT